MYVYYLSSVFGSQKTVFYVHVCVIPEYMYIPFNIICYFAVSSNSKTVTVTLHNLFQSKEQQHNNI